MSGFDVFFWLPFSIKVCTAPGAISPCRQKRLPAALLQGEVRGVCDCLPVTSHPSRPINFTCAGHHRSLRCNAIVDQVLGFSFFSRSSPKSIPSYPSRQSDRSSLRPALQLSSLALPWPCMCPLEQVHCLLVAGYFLCHEAASCGKVEAVLFGQVGLFLPAWSLVACVRDP